MSRVRMGSLLRQLVARRTALVGAAIAVCGLVGLAALAALASCAEPSMSGGSSGAPGESPDAGGASPSANDGIKNGDESDVDCGGSSPNRCTEGMACRVANDCADGVCTAGRCAAPSPTDGVKNGDETDVDCGGTKAPKCKVGQTCERHDDCTSNGCNYAKTCALAPSCAVHHGGDTCGAGLAGQDRDPNSPPDAVAHESCCIALPVPMPDGTTQLVDKYLVTAGRMRAFIERYDGNLEKFIEDAKPKDWWKDEWTEYLPGNMAEALFKLGPYPDEGFTRQGCVMAPGGGGARTYWQPANNPAYPDEKQSYAQDVLDEKALNCVEFFMLSAFCLWDGGHLAHSADLVAAWGPAKYPWGDAPNADQSSTTAMSHVVHEFGPRFEGPYSYTWPLDNLDQTAHIAPPGRKPLGKGPYGHMDLAGLMLPVTSGFGTAPNGQSVPIWIHGGSWEAHEIYDTTEKRYYVANDSYKRAYWAAGGRCSR